MTLSDFAENMLSSIANSLGEIAEELHRLRLLKERETGYNSEENNMVFTKCQYCGKELDSFRVSSHEGKKRCPSCLGILGDL